MINGTESPDGRPSNAEATQQKTLEMILQQEGISYEELMSENEQYLQQISEICRELDVLEEEQASRISKDVEMSLSKTSEISNG
eukprot:746001-Hanusia_phi.AAC.5